MRKKITMLLASLFACVGVMKAGVTDFPEMSTGEDIKWYTISNTRSASGKYLYWTESGVKDSNTRTGASFFYVTGSADACYIHNYSTNLLFSGAGAWTEAGVACKLTVSPLNTGLMIGFNGTYLNEQNSANGFTTWGNINDEGSVFVFEEVTDFSAIIDVPAAKAAAIAEIENYAVETSIYPAATDAVAAVNAVNPASNGLKDLDDAVEAINAIVVDYREKAYQALEGKFFTIQTCARTQGFMQMATSNVVGSELASSPANLWQFVCNVNGTVNVYNPYTGKYLCEPQGNSSEVAVTTDKANAGAYVLNVNASASVANAKVKFTSNGKSVHMAGGHTLVRWDNGGASEWQVVEVKDFSSIINSYKTASIASMGEWKTLSVVFDAALIEAAEAAINGIATTDWATFAAIDAELKKVTDAVAAKMFTFQTTATDNHRNGVWVSANMSTRKAIGLHGEHNYNSIWSLRHAGGVAFYLYNELNSVYMGAPSGNCALTETPAVAYTFEIIDAENSIVEMHVGGETLHASNHNDDKLLNWDGNEAASRWIISTIDVAADIQTLLDGLTEDDYAEVPALGQYPTAAYEALVEARTSAKTVEEVEAAIAAFKATYNIPVYFITSKHEGYAAGSAIYYDGAWKWKAANKFDKQMWMTIPGYTEENVPAVDAYDAEGTSYAICDYLTGTKMRGKDVQIVKVADWEGAYNLQYNADATSTDAAQHAKDNGQLVNWKPGTKNDAQASVWGVEYIGNTYDLDKLTDEHINALAAMQTAYSAKVRYADVVIGDGIGEYQGNKDALVAALEAAEAISGKSLVELATMSVDDILAAKDAINNAEALVINQPKAGFYRIKSMNANDENKKGKNLLVSEGALALDKTESAASIMYIDAANGILNYGSGLYINTWNAPAEVGAQAVGWNFIENAQVAGTYALKYNDNAGGQLNYYLSDWTGNVTYGQNDANAAWIFEEVTELPVAITAAGYATLYAPVALDPAEGVTAHTVTIDGDKAILSEALEVIPAETGVILVGTENTYNFTVATTDETATSVLDGTFAKTYIKDDAYVLANKDGIGLYKAAKNQQEGTAFLNNAFKAYLPATAVPSGAQALRFTRGGDDETTSIDLLINTDSELVIYDLAGRRVQKMEKGIYIVNGKKVIR